MSETILFTETKEIINLSAVQGDTIVISVTEETINLNVVEGGISEINAQKIQNVPVSEQAPEDNQVLMYNAAEREWEPSAVGIITKIAGQVLSANKAIVLNSAGKVIFADKDNIDHFFKVYGVTRNSAILDETVEITTYGEHENNTWSWELDKAIYLSTGGELTQAPPTTGFIIQIGFPVTATTVFVNIKSSLNLGG